MHQIIHDVFLLFSNSMERAIMIDSMSRPIVQINQRQNAYY